MPYPAYQPFRYRSFLQKEKRFRINLKPLKLENWLEPDDRFALELNERERIQKEHPNQVFYAEASSRPSQIETVELILDFLLHHHGDCWDADAHTITDKQRGIIWKRSDFEEAPLMLASKLVQDDLVLMTPCETGYRLCAASVCFPSNWDLTKKVGKPLLEIHAPVPGLDGRTGQLIDGIFNNFRTKTPGWRINWSLMTHGSLYSPTPKGRKLTLAELEDFERSKDWYLRVERQALRRLPKAGDILFTVRIYHDPFEEMLRQPDCSDIHAHLIAAVAALGDAERGYKGFIG